jgi:hypothetical protein
MIWKIETRIHVEACEDETFEKPARVYCKDQRRRSKGWVRVEYAGETNRLSKNVMDFHDSTSFTCWTWRTLIRFRLSTVSIALFFAD